MEATLKPSACTRANALFCSGVKWKRPESLGSSAPSMAETMP